MVTTDQLMQLALNKYRTLQLRGEWTQPSSEAKQLQALSAQIAALKDKQLKLTSNQSKKKDKAKSKDGKKNNNKSSKKDKRTGKKWAWLTIQPKDGEPTTKEVDGTQWHWCEHHQKWQQHSTDQCRLGNKPDNNKKGKGGKKYVARTAIADDDDDESDSSDSDNSF